MTAKLCWIDPSCCGFLKIRTARFCVLFFYSPTGRPRRTSLPLECHRKTTKRTRSVSSARLSSSHWRESQSAGGGITEGSEAERPENVRAHVYIQARTHQRICGGEVTELSTNNHSLSLTVAEMQRCRWRTDTRESPHFVIRKPPDRR